MYESFTDSPLQRSSWLNLNRIVQALELIQDLIVICLCFGLFSFMMLQIKTIDFLQMFGFIGFCSLFPVPCSRLLQEV